MQVENPGLLEEFEYLWLVSRIVVSLENHLGCSDFTLAEFLISLAKAAATQEQFSKSLSERKANLPEALECFIFRAVYDFYNPKPIQVQPDRFSCLSIPNERPSFSTRHRSPSRKRYFEDRSAPVDADDATFKRKDPLKKRISSPERWELKQLAAAGAMDASAIYSLEQSSANGDPIDTEKEFLIERNPQEPAFLRGQTDQSVEFSPVRIVKNPEGSLSRAALAVSAIARERRDFSSSRKGPPVVNGVVWQDSVISEEQHLPPIKRIRNETIREQRESLPVFKFRNEIVAAVKKHPILIVIGETGSGKTTQMTQYLAEEGYTRTGMIGCTQPRRVAATSVARRVAEEVGCRVGDTVGYTIRFEDCTSRRTCIKYMTDGMLLREALLDPLLSAYSVIILDEAHERTVSTDVLFALLKEATKKRSDLRFIVTSATLDAQRFSRYFFDCPIFTVPGRSFPVEVFYAKQPETDYLNAALLTVLQVHATEGPGDILLFLTGQEEIENACQILEERSQELGSLPLKLIVLPIYSSLPSDHQSKIFEATPSGYRKVVVATNIAEASITINGIFFVVDPGFVKQKVYNPRLGMDSLVVMPISQASAKQRSGRAGRTGPGKCFRLYTEHAYLEEMLSSSVPEIQRTNLANTVLTLKAMGINDLLHFDFIDPPSVSSMVAALHDLYNLGALDDDGLLTSLGRRMAEFPLEPPLAKMLIFSCETGCSDEVLSIVALISVQSPFYRPKDRQEEADRTKSRFHQSEGDHLTLLTVYQRWKEHGYNHNWAYENYLQVRTLKRAREIRSQLLALMDRYGEPLISCGLNYDRVRRAVTAGFFTHAAKRDPQEGYRTASEDLSVFIHPSSCLFQRNPEWVVYHELVMTSREYMREVTVIDPKWLAELAPGYFRTADSMAPDKRKDQHKLQPLYNKHDGPNDWRLSSRRVVKISQKF